jgi:hypothetical protein
VSVIRALRETASKAGSPDNTYGNGIPDAVAALHWTAPIAGVPDPTARGGVALLGANPMRGAGTSVRFDAAGAASAPEAATVRVIDVSGRTVRTLWSGTLAANRSLAVRWDGLDAGGHSAGRGRLLDHARLRHAPRIDQDRFVVIEVGPLSACRSRRTLETR